MDYLVEVTLRIPERMRYRLTKQGIRSREAELVAANWGTCRQVKKQQHNTADSAGRE